MNEEAAVFSLEMGKEMALHIFCLGMWSRHPGTLKGFDLGYDIIGSVFYGKPRSCMATAERS